MNLSLNKLPDKINGEIMEREFKGRAVLPGRTSGKAVVTKKGLNTLATFMKSIVLKSKKAVGNDQNNPEIYKKILNGKILCLTQTIGSTTAGLIIMNLADMNIAPKAMLFSESIDSLAAAGVVLSDIWIGKRIITVDRLGDEFLEFVKDDMDLTISEDGVISVY